MLSLPPSPYFAFDLDETLIASKDAILTFQRQLFARMGKPFPESEAELFYTLDREQVRSRFFTPEEIPLLERHISELSSTLEFQGIRKKPGADELLTFLTEKDLPRGILTNRGSSTLPLLKHLGWEGRFSPVLSAPENPFPKPDHRALYEFARRASVPPERLVFIGDSEVDRHCAERAGVCFLGVGKEETGWFPDLLSLLRFLKEEAIVT